MNAEPSHDELVSRKIEAIQAEIERKNREAASLLQYLSVQQTLAKAEEEKEEDDLKRQGVIVGQHIPSLPSKLDLNPHEIAQYETFSTTLLVARDLVTQNRTNFLRRTGNLPISDLAESKRLNNQKYATQDGDKPHYLETTTNTKNREDRVQVRFGETIQATKATKALSPTKRDESLLLTKSISDKTKKAMDQKISAKERLEHENVLKSINHKLNYLRNPRNNPNAVTKMLVKPKDFHTKYPQAGNGGGSSVAGGVSSSSSHQEGSVGEAGSAVQDSHAGSGAASSAGASSITEALKSKYAKFIKLTDNPLFICEPGHVLFMDYELNTKYTKTISFRNISAVSRTLRVVAPKINQVFNISPLKYPPNCNGGMVAPGMSVTCTLTFTPNALGDYEDYIVVESEAGSSQVKIMAQREPPNLSIPSQINLGYCLVGDAQRSAMSCTNTGGTGRFTIVEQESDLESIPADDHGNRCLRLPPFTIYPTQFELHKGQSMELVFEFLPLTLGVATKTFIVYCDNGQIREFTLQAKSKELNLSTIELNQVGFDETDTTVYRDVYFDQLDVGAEQSQQVMVVNDTGISVEYEWVWLEEDANGSQQAWHAQGQDMIYERQAAQRPFSSLEDRHEPGYDLDDASATHNNHHSLTDAPVNHALLRSLKENLTNTKGEDSLAHEENSVRREGFEIVPARGVLAGEGASEFKIIYAPTKAPSSKTLRAVMMIKSVPRAALPGGEQEEELSLLAQVGHGPYPRLLSWLEDIGTPADVERYQLPNGSWTSTKSMLSLNTIVGMIISHVLEQPAFTLHSTMSAQEVEDIKERAIEKVNRWVRNILKHVYEFRKNEAIPDDQSTVASSVASQYRPGVSQFSSHSSLHGSRSQRSHLSHPTNPSNNGEMIELYEWNNTDMDAHGELESSKPRVIKSVQLFYEEPKNEESDDDESIVEGGRPDGTLPSLHEFSSDDRVMMSEVWLDSSNVLRLLGDYANDFLNNKVQHEAVDFLKENALSHLAYVNFLVHGRSQLQEMTVTPPCLEVGGVLSIGKAWHGEVDITNHTEAPMQLLIQCQDLVVRKVAINNNTNPHHNIASMLSTDEYESPRGAEFLSDKGSARSLTPRLNGGNAGNAAKQDVVIQSDYERLLVMPHSTERFAFDLTVNVVGKYEVTIPVKALDTTAKIEDILIRLLSTGPKVRFDHAEVDIGLLGVGGEVTHTLSFTNEGDVPVVFMVKPTLHVDSTQANNNQIKKVGSFLLGGGNGNNTSRPNTHRDNAPLSARSNISRQSSIHSDDFSVADSQATSNNGDFKIELKNAVVNIEPSSGLVAPQSTINITVITKAGKTPQRIRGMLENRIFDSSGRIELTRQFINLRGEVQSPKVLLYPMQHNVGQVFVGRTVHFSFTLENICNLPTKFKFLRPGGKSALFDFSLSPKKGSLDAKEKLTIHGTFTALQAGLVDDIISCKMFGIPKPLGFTLKAIAKGITLEFINVPNLEDGTVDPAQQSMKVLPLASPEDVQFPNHEKPPEPHPIEPLFLGPSVPLYDRRNIRFFIRNLSAIPAPFSIQPRKFCVMEKNWKGTLSVASSATASTFTQAPRQDLVLAPHEDGTDRFQSEAGKKYIGATINRREDRKFLKSGFGASYLVDCVQGELPPWGVQEVNVFAFNDIPGCYDDSIEVSLFENDIIRKFSLPVKMTVQGCPIVVEKSSVGMTEINAAHIKHHPKEFIGRQLLNLGQACEHGQPLHREFYVRNNGSKPGKLKWLIRGLASKTNGPLKVSLAVNEEGKLKTSYQFWEEIAKQSPFKVEPMDATIPPYGKQRFTATLTRSSPATIERAEFTATVVMQGSHDDDDLHGDEESVDMASIATDAVSLPPKPKEEFTVNLLVEGEYLHPKLVVDKHTFVAPEPETNIPDSQALHLSAKATLLFSSAGKPANVCSKLITITNPIEAEIVINAVTEGPYVIREVTENNYTQKSVTRAPSSTSIVNQGEETSVVTSRTSTSMGKVFHMMPHQTTKFMLAFNPKRNVREELLATFGTEAGKPTESKGALVFAYPTGQKLRIPVITAISTPFITGSSPRVYFGVCHVRENCNAVYLVSNPTDVPARWTVTHVPGGGAWKQTTAIRVKGFDQNIHETDDPSVFTITPNAGMIEGPTVSVTAAMAAPPKDYNRAHDRSIVPERLVESSWATQTLTIGDSLELKHKGKTTTQPAFNKNNEAEALFPMPLNIIFAPKKNVRYCCRFRFTGEFANSFDLVLQGEGTFEEHEHRPLNPLPR